MVSNNKIMKRKYFYIQMLLILFLTSCISTKEKSRESHINNSKIVALIRSGEKEISKNHYSFDSIGKSLNQIFENDNKNNFILIQDSIDVKKGNIYPKYKVVTDVNVLRDLYVFSICVLNKDTLIVNNKYESYHDLDTLIYIFNKTIVDKGLTEKRISKSINYFNASKIQEINFILKADINTKKRLSDAEWQLYFNSLGNINSFKKSIQNKMAINNFGKPFEYLLPSQKDAIIHVKRVSIILSFNTPCVIYKKPSKKKVSDSSLVPY